MKSTYADQHRPVVFDRFPRTLDGSESAATTGVACDDAVDPDDGVLFWFGLDPDTHGGDERPDELARLSLTTNDDAGPPCGAEYEGPRWM